MTFRKCPITYTETKYDWSFLDLIVCICLKERIDRYDECVKIFNNYGLSDQVVFYMAERPTQTSYDNYLKQRDMSTNKKPLTKGEYGCWKSHQAANQYGRKRGVKRLLVLEDDVEMLSTLTPESLNNVKLDIDGFEKKTQTSSRAHSKNSSDIIHLGYFPITGYPLVGYKTLWKIKSVCTVAYISTESSQKTMAEMPDNKIVDPIDLWMCRYCDQYAVYPKLFYQRESPTSIQEGAQKTTLDRLNVIYRTGGVQMWDFVILICLPLVVVLLLLGTIVVVPVVITKNNAVITATTMPTTSTT